MTSSGRQLPQPILLGYRPRKPWKAEGAFRVAGVTVASASDCLCEAFIGNEKYDWSRLNSATHYETMQEAIDAAHRAGASDFEIHATRLWPLLFDEGKQQEFTLVLTQPNGRPSRPQLAVSYSSLGFDSVSFHSVGASDDGLQLKSITFECSPLSCNGRGVDYPVNEWSLLDCIDDAIAAAIEFSNDGSGAEPGPYVVVEVLRCEVQVVK